MNRTGLFWTIFKIKFCKNQDYILPKNSVLQHLFQQVVNLKSKLRSRFFKYYSI